MSALNQNISRHRQYLFIGGGIVFFIIVTGLYFTGGRIVSTDDAYVQAARVDISANISAVVHVNAKTSDIEELVLVLLEQVLSENGAIVDQQAASKPGLLNNIELTLTTVTEPEGALAQ